MSKVDREGNIIKVGHAVAMAITVNHHMHFESYSVLICKEKDGELILHGAGNWALLNDLPPDELQIIHEGVDLWSLDCTFTEKFGPSPHSFNKKDIRTADAHQFYGEIVRALSQCTAEYLDIKDHRQAKQILLQVLSLSKNEPDVLKTSVTELTVRAASMAAILEQAMTAMKAAMGRN